MIWHILTALLAVQARAQEHGIDKTLAEAAILTARAVDHDHDSDLEVMNEHAYADRSAPVVARATTNVSTTAVGNGVVLNADGTINMTAWDETATAACNAVLAKLAASTNPSGTCTCYNLPALDNSTGSFEADLRLFQISAARDEFSGIAAENIKVGLTYTGASVSPVTAASAAKLVVGRDTASNATGLLQLQQYLLIGQINKDQMTESLTMAELEALVMPIVTLTGTNAAGQTVATNVSGNEAAFVAGVFSDQVVMSETGLAQAAVDAVVAELASGTVAFVLPGVQLMIFPVGLVIVSVWLAIGVAAVGMGFVQRVAFRESYRTRSMQSVKTGSGRI